MGSRILILLDTHVLIWWANGDHAKLSPASRSAIDSAGEGDLAISSITIWETSMLIAQARLILTIDIRIWLKTISHIPTTRFIPVDNDIAIESVELPASFHNDPADRMIVATARRLAIPIVTADQKIRDYPHVRTIW